MRFFVGLGSKDNEYKIGNVNFTVKSRFQKFEIKNVETISDRVKRIITSDFVDLTDKSPPSKMAVEYVCSAAGKEDLCSRKRKKNNWD